MNALLRLIFGWLNPVEGITFAEVEARLYEFGL